jgi:hypothetical protein
LSRFRRAGLSSIEPADVMLGVAEHEPSKAAPHDLERICGLGAPPTSSTELMGELVVVDQSAERGGERSRILSGDDDPS